MDRQGRASGLARYQAAGTAPAKGDSANGGGLRCGVDSFGAGDAVRRNCHGDNGRQEDDGEKHPDECPLCDAKVCLYISRTVWYHC